MSGPEQDKATEAVKSLSRSFTRRIFVIAVIESLGAAVLVALNLTGVIAQDAMAVGIAIWAGIIAIPLLLFVLDFRKKQALLRKLENNQADRPNPIQKH